jgi:hypothetical protein
LIACVRSDDGTEEQASAGSNSRAVAAADRGASNGADSGSDGRAAHGGFFRGLFRSHPADLLKRITLTFAIVQTELSESFPRTRQSQGARPRGNTGASACDQNGCQSDSGMEWSHQN